MTLSAWGNIVLGVYSAVLTTIVVIRGIKEKQRRLSISVSTEWRPAFHDRVGPLLLLITVTNPGHRRVTVNIPYLGLPEGKHLVTPMPLSNVRFPYRLEEGENCAIWIEMNEVKRVLQKMEYSGIVKLKGKVSDGTKKVYTSRKSCEFDIDKEYDNEEEGDTREDGLNEIRGSPYTSEKKFTIRGYLKGYTAPALYEEADTLEEARTLATKAIEQTSLEKVVIFEEVDAEQKGIANTIQRNEKGEIEELEGWHYGEEEV